MKRVLVLGAGLVARPLVRRLLAEGHHVLVATHPDTLRAAQKMIAGFEHAEAHPLDVADDAGLSERVRDCDVAVSLLPFMYHPQVARHCVLHRKDLVTTSYVSEEMKALSSKAKEAGVTLLNEMGLDPGIDHMSAMRLIDRVRQAGGKVVSFKSYCGGLPAPEANDNPFGYKFSWSPRGVLLAARNGAEYLLDGRKISVPPERVFRDMHILQLPGVGDFEAYPNRDSLSYVEVYGLSGIRTMLRATLRNMGWCDCLHNYRRLGLLDTAEQDVKGLTWAELMRRLSGASPKQDLSRAVAKKLSIPARSLPVMNLRWLGMFSDRRFKVDRISPLDALGTLMAETLAYKPKERDMVVLFHELQAEYPGGKAERLTSQLVAFGEPGGDSAMSRTVSLPAALATELLLAGKVKERGVLRPVTAALYGPVLERLGGLGIRCEEKVEAL
jgi:saccharopine dehydrogenase (NADP+, L-glutamate forming)